MGGVGSAIGLVPIFSMMDMPLNLAKAIGLFINSASTITASVMNFFRGVLDVKFAIPLIVFIMIATPIGAWMSQYIQKEIVEWILVSFLLISALLLIFSNREQKVVYDKAWILYVIGAVVGLVSGTIGVGGGSLIMPLLILLGFDAKKAAYAVSFVIPFSTLGAFATYLSFVDMDWKLLGFVLLLLAAKMIYKLLGV